MALERVPADIRAQGESHSTAILCTLLHPPPLSTNKGGVARMTDPKLIKEIKAAVSIPVMAKARIGHFVEAQILEALAVDCIDESEVLTPADGRGVNISTLAQDAYSNTFPFKTASTLTRASSRFPLCAAPATWARPCAASTRAPP
jgi:pyridoxal biosynthesis lyase PdxS